MGMDFRPVRMNLLPVTVNLEQAAAIAKDFVNQRGTFTMTEALDTVDTVSTHIQTAVTYIKDFTQRLKDQAANNIEDVTARLRAGLCKDFNVVAITCCHNRGFIFVFTRDEPAAGAYPSVLGGYVVVVKKFEPAYIDPTKV